jgi:hypothetical protein
MAIRMFTRSWTETGRGYQLLEGVLLGFSNTHATSSVALRLARAVSIRDLCSVNSTRGGNLVQAIQVIPLSFMF